MKLSAGTGLAGAIRLLAGSGLIAPVRFFFEDAPGAASGCAAIMLKHPQMARFAPPRARHAGLSCWLTNLGAKWGPSCPQASGEEVDWPSLEAVAAGIGQEFTLGAANVILGPVQWHEGAPAEEACAKPPQPGEPYLSARFPIAVYLASGVILQRMTSGSVRVAITCQSRQESDAVPASIERVLASLGEQAPERWIHVPASLRIIGDPAMKMRPGEITEKYRNGMAEMARSMNLPHRLPAGQELLTAPRAPLKSPRKLLAEAFARSGWKPSNPQPPRGSHRFEKTTEAGNRLLLEFDTGTMIASLTTFLALVSKEGVFRLPVPASGQNSAQQLTPNPELFRMAIENANLLVAHLERTWVAELESALAASQG